MDLALQYQDRQTENKSKLYDLCLTFMSREVSGTKQKNSTSLSSMDVLKATKGLIILTPEIDRNKTAMGLPPFTSAVFLIAN
jgi:hypothetical protein